VIGYSLQSFVHAGRQYWNSREEDIRTPPLISPNMRMIQGHWTSAADPRNIEPMGAEKFRKKLW